MRIRLQPFDVNLEYKPGKEFILADALWRAHLDTEIKDPDINASILNINLKEYMSDSRKLEFLEETKKDQELQTI